MTTIQDDRKFKASHFRDIDELCWFMQGECLYQKIAPTSARTVVSSGGIQFERSALVTPVEVTIHITS